MYFYYIYYHSLTGSRILLATKTCIYTWLFMSLRGDDTLDDFSGVLVTLMVGIFCPDIGGGGGGGGTGGPMCLDGVFSSFTLFLFWRLAASLSEHLTPLDSEKQQKYQQ